MDRTASHDGYFLAATVDLIPPPAPSPWLRLAHHQTYVGNHAPLARERSILDYEFIIQDRADSWIGFPDRDGFVPLPQGSVALVPPGLRHGQVTLPGSHYAVHFDIVANPSLVAPAMLTPYGRSLGPGRRELHPTLLVANGDTRREVPLVQHPDRLDWWTARARSLVDLWLPRRRVPETERLRVLATLSEMLHAFLVQADASSGATDPDPDPATRVGELLARTTVLDRALTVTELARRARMGETTFRAAVRRLTGTTPAAWLEQRRCDHAVMLLQNTVLSVRAVAEACGYDDPYHFSRVIRRRLGRSPTEIRRGA